MIILKVIYICLSTLIIIILLKKISPEFVPLVAVLSGGLIITCSFPYLNSIIDMVSAMKNNHEFASGAIELCIKIVSISLMCEFASQLCDDSGEGYLSSNITFAGKVIILALVSPMVSSFLTKILNMINEL